MYADLFVLWCMAMGHVTGSPLREYCDGKPLGKYCVPDGSGYYTCFINTFSEPETFFRECPVTARYCTLYLSNIFSITLLSTDAKLESSIEMKLSFTLEIIEICVRVQQLIIQSFQV